MFSYFFFVLFCLSYYNEHTFVLKNNKITLIRTKINTFTWITFLNINYECIRNIQDIFFREGREGDLLFIRVRKIIQRKIVFIKEAIKENTNKSRRIKNFKLQ